MEKTDLPADYRINSFTLLRLGLALSVVFLHGCGLGGFNEPGRIAMFPVLAFFVISGFLLAQSLSTYPSVSRFLFNRAARILPALWVNLLLVGLVLMPLLIMMDQQFTLSYWESATRGPDSSLTYAYRNLAVTTIQANISGLFEHQPNPAVNGSLWSLSPESICYIILACMGSIGLLRRPKTYTALTIIFFSYHLFLQFREPEIRAIAPDWSEIYFEHIFRYPSFYLAFALGACAHLWRRRIIWDYRIAGVALIALAISLPLKWTDYIWPLPTTYLILFLGLRLPFSRFEKFGDISYGVYIYSFPIQQTMTMLGFPRFGIVAYIVVSVVLSILAGIASWRCIEHPILQAVKSIRWKHPITPIASQHASNLGEAPNS